MNRHCSGCDKLFVSSPTCGIYAKQCQDCIDLAVYSYRPKKAYKDAPNDYAEFVVKYNESYGLCHCCRLKTSLLYPHLADWFVCMECLNMYGSLGDPEVEFGGQINHGYLLKKNFPYDYLSSFVYMLANYNGQLYLFEYEKSDHYEQMAIDVKRSVIPPVMRLSRDGILMPKYYQQHKILVMKIPGLCDDIKHLISEYIEDIEIDIIE